MKKNLVLALALMFVLSIAGTAFAAANPFVDVPAKHWAYDAVSKLAKAGIVDGYGDGTFRGDKTMTRYEMAQIVAKAMAKSDKANAEQKAMIDKLSVEFAGELNNLGVRVAKLEKNASSIKITGDARLRYESLKDDANTWKNRFRVNMYSDVNDKVSFYGRYVYSDAEFGTTGDTNKLTDMNFTYKGMFGNTTNLTAGRYSLFMGTIGYLSDTTGDVDGIQFNTKTGKATMMAGYGNANRLADTKTATVVKDIVVAEAGYAFDKTVGIKFDYLKNLKETSNSSLGIKGDEFNVIGGSAYYAFGDWKLTGEYYKNSAGAAKTANNGSTPAAYFIRAAYKGADKAKPQSWGAYLEYSKQDYAALPYAFYGPAGKNGSYTTNGVKSWMLGTSYTLAKNVTFEGFYQFDLKDTDGNKITKLGSKDVKNYTRMQVNFFF